MTSHESNKEHVVLFHRGDRLGANITSYIAQILYALYHRLPIKYDRNALNYKTSVFVEALFDFIEFHNRHLSQCGKERPWDNPGDWVYTVSHTTQTLQCDQVSFFRQHIWPRIRLNFYSHVAYKNYSLPFDPKTTILVHLRLGDVSTVADYDGRVCNNYYKQKVEAGQPCICEGLTMNRYNRQAPLSDQKLEEQLTQIRKAHPHHTVRLITQPGSVPTLPYECIRSDDESYDLWLMSMCDIIVLSRSTYALSALFFGAYSEAHVPLWGHAACMGLYTVYDRAGLTYFY